MQGDEEGLGERLRHCREIALTYAQRALAARSLRVYETMLYASILRFDGDPLLNWPLDGAAAAESPMLHSA